MFSFCLITWASTYLYCQHKKKPRQGATLSNASTELKKVWRATFVHNTACDVTVKGVNPFSKHRAKVHNLEYSKQVIPF